MHNKRHVRAPVNNAKQWHWCTSKIGVAWAINNTATWLTALEKLGASIYAAQNKQVATDQRVTSISLRGRMNFRLNNSNGKA